VSGGSRFIAIEEMGAGVANLLGMIVDLCMAEEKIIVMEEPENDLHPQALKALCRLIVGKSLNNQFLISTHSNIVLQELGSVSTTCVFRVVADKESIPWKSRCERLDTTEERLDVLRDMGYALHDFSLYEGWLFLEEASAETLLKDYLIPWFVPQLRDLRTVAGRGVSTVKPMFDEFRRLFLFAHLERLYKGRAWVLVDGDEVGRQVVRQLREDFGDWPEDHFRFLAHGAIEYYFPQAFRTRYVEKIEVLVDPARRNAKRERFSELRKWLDDNPDDGKVALLESAEPLISFLREVAAALA
jgi:predicted ATP-dependent endonuclease of OLD family